jgi:4-azaleucine resistance transporter AzlC
MRGARDTGSLLLGFIPISMAFGIAARQYGFSALDSCLMSLLVFAGASQFIGVAMIAAGAGVMEVAITTFFVNLRHAIMTASLAVYLKGCPRSLLSLLAFQTTDESFGLSITRFARGEADRWYLLAVNLITYTTWNVGTLAGYMVGELLPDVVRNAMAFALPAVFLSLLVMACRDRITVVVALFSSVLSLALYAAHVSMGNVILVGIAGATLGMVVEQWKGR